MQSFEEFYYSIDNIPLVSLNDEIMENKFKKAIGVGAMIAASLFGGEQKEVPLNELIDVLKEVESNYNDQAIGDNGKAKGILQIWDVMVRDFNRITGKNYTHDDAFDKKKSEEMAKAVLKHYGKYIHKTTKKLPDARQLARIWNGGGSAWKPKSGSYEKKLENYWNKVSKELRERGYM